MTSKTMKTPRYFWWSVLAFAIVGFIGSFVTTHGRECVTLAKGDTHSRFAATVVQLLLWYPAT
jgi:hypothetical protein